jgi:2'-5' RNA ligase
MAFEAGVIVNSNNVFVGNLAWGTSSDRLREHFSGCGNVINAVVKVDRDGRSRGCGVVEFDSAQAALAAMQSLNETELDGRQIFVRKDRDTPKPAGKAPSDRRLFVSNLADSCTSPSRQPRSSGPGTTPSHHYSHAPSRTQDVRGGAAATLPHPAATASFDWQKGRGRSALCIIPDESVWPDIQAIRRDHDANVERWMPHINIIFPFVNQDDPAQLACAAHALAAELRHTAPFDIRLDHIEFFEDSERKKTEKNEKVFFKEAICNFWLSPATRDGRISDIHRIAANLFPICKKGFFAERQFTPHLTVGQVAGPVTEEKKAESTALWRGSRAFTCSRVFVVARYEKDAPFRVRHIVPLGGGGSVLSGNWQYISSEGGHCWLDLDTNEPCMRLP